MSDFIIYTDGACSGNPGPGGWAFVAVESSGTGTKIESSGSELNTTNNRMELTAVINGISFIKAIAYSSMLILTDSKYIVDAVNQGWLNSWVSKNWKKSDGKSVLNQDLWSKLLELMSIYNISFQWVKGHAGIPENERCDELARKEIKKLRELYG
jgi:ribonuclease HI